MGFSKLKNIKYYQRPTIYNCTNSKICVLTEVERERLQGFPDDWTQYGDYGGIVKPISRRQRYKLIGNAVTVDIVELIAKRLKITKQ